MSYSGYSATIGILISDSHSEEDVLNCMESCQGYPIWVHANTNDNKWADHMKRVTEEKGRHYFSQSISNGTPGKGKNMLMTHFTLDSNLKYFTYCYNIDGDDAWGSTMPELFKRKYDGDFLFSSGGKYQWKDETYDKLDLAKLSEQIRDDLGDKYEGTSYISQWLDLRVEFAKYFQHPNNEHGTLNRLIGFSKLAINNLQFKEDVEIAEDIIFHIEALMKNKQGNFKIQYLYDEDLYLYKPNERGIHYNTIPVLSGELLQKLKAYLPPTYPKSLKKYKVDWVL